MPAVRVLADEHIKFTILTTAPEDEAAPTAAELNAGIDASCLVFADDFRWTPTDSERVGERALCESTAAEAPGLSNYDLAFTAWRYFDSVTGAPDMTADELFQAVKVKGTELWGYVRRTGKLHSAVWATGDEIQLGGRFTTDTPQTDGTGFVKYRIPTLPQAMHDFIAVDAGA
jgi:hypothetical protein